MSERQKEFSTGRGVGTGTHRTTFDPTDPDQPSAALVEAVALARDADPLELEPLHTYVDTDALNSLVDGKRAAGTTVSLSIDGYEFVVDGSGTVVAEPVEE